MYLQQKTGLSAKHGEKISTCRSPQKSERPGKMKDKYDARSAEKNYNFEPLGHKTRTLGYQIGKPGNWLNLGAGHLRPDWDTGTPGHQTGTPGHQTGTLGHQTGTPGHQTGTPGHQTGTLGHQDTRPGHQDTRLEPPGAGGSSSVFPHAIRTL